MRYGHDSIVACWVLRVEGPVFRRLGGGRRRGGGHAGAAVNPGQLSHSAVFPAFRPRAGRQSARDEVALQLHPGGQGHHVEACREQ